jgi:hypothetical protein
MMSKILLPVLTLNLLIFGLAARLREMFERNIPVGYQDQTGFHLGVKR